MWQQILIALGGIGLFLAGMAIMTDGLKSLAAGSTRRILVRFTKSPVSGAATGAVTTAIIQSSSATTVSAVGFVAAGLLTFPQAVGIIFGANIGTTITGWLVAIFGFKLQLGLVVLPLILVAVLLRMFAGGRLGQVGWALVGFCLIFIGIDTLQKGMAFAGSALTPSDFPDDTFVGRLQLVGIGIAITLVTQSSSAGVATAMVALGAGAISFPQAAAMVIGMDIGTSCSAILATVGGSSAVRRTGYAHAVYNLMTGMLAFALLTPYTNLVSASVFAEGQGNPQIALVLFHTVFNVLGVTLILPFARPFAAMMTWLVPDKGSRFVQNLDPRLLHDGQAALDAATGSLQQISLATLSVMDSRLDLQGRADARSADLGEIQQAIDQTRAYIARVSPRPAEPGLGARRASALHILDHLDRLVERCRQVERVETQKTEAALVPLSARLRQEVGHQTKARQLAESESSLDLLRQEFREARREIRRQFLQDAGATTEAVDHATRVLDAVRWLHRVAYHLWRIAHHHRLLAELKPAESVAPEAKLEEAEDLD